MTADQLLKDGKVADAVRDLQDQIRKDPADQRLRIFLFQLLTVQGEWNRAMTQLCVAAELDPIAVPMAQTYREALRCEALRAEIFAGELLPTIFGEPPEWIGMLVHALQHTAKGEHAAGAALREQAFAAAPATSGAIDDQPFEWIADADPRIGPVVEAIVAGRYYWIPFENIAEMRIEAPADLRDSVWMPVDFVWTNGGQNVGLMPTRYPGSENSDDELTRLARQTTWTEFDADSGLFIGQGQRMFATDQGEHPLMDTRRIVLGNETPDG